MAVRVPEFVEWTGYSRASRKTDRRFQRKCRISLASACQAQVGIRHWDIKPFRHESGNDLGVISRVMTARPFEPRLRTACFPEEGRAGRRDSDAEDRDKQVEAAKLPQLFQPDVSCLLRGSLRESACRTFSRHWGTA